MPNAEVQKQRLQQKLQEAAEALKTYQYVVLIRTLIVIAELQRQLSSEQASEITEVSINDEQLFTLRVFQTIWNDDHDVKSQVEDKNAKYLAARFPFSQERAAKVSEGLDALNARVVLKKTQEEAKDKNQNIKEKNKAIYEKLEKQDQQIYAAIRGYETKRQKAVRYVGYFLAGVCSFVFGVIETGVSVALLLPATMPLYAFYIPAAIVTAALYKFKPGIFKKPGYISLIAATFILPLVTPLAMVYIPAIALATMATWLNWKTFKPYVPSLLKMLVGKDKYFDGVTSYVDKEGNKVQLSKKRLLALGVFSVLALLTGATIGALGYGAILQTTSLPVLGALFGAISAALGPIGIALAGIVAITMTLMLAKGVVDLLKNKKLKDGFKSNFKAISTILEKNKAGIFTKGAVWFMTGLLAIVGLMGLGFACYSATRPLGKFFMDQFNAVPQLAQTIANGIAYGAAFASRVWFTFRNMLNASRAVLNRIYRKKMDENTTEPAENNKSAEKLLIAGMEAGSEAAFYSQTVLAANAPLSAAVATGVLTGTRTFGTNAAHVDDPDQDPFEVDACQIASTKRQEKFMSTYANDYIKSGFFSSNAQASRAQRRETYRQRETTELGKLPKNDSRVGYDSSSNKEVASASAPTTHCRDEVELAPVLVRNVEYKL